MQVVHRQLLHQMLLHHSLNQLLLRHQLFHETVGAIGDDDRFGTGGESLRHGRAEQASTHRLVGFHSPHVGRFVLLQWVGHSDPDIPPSLHALASR